VPYAQALGEAPFDFLNILPELPSAQALGKTPLFFFKKIAFPECHMPMYSGKPPLFFLFRLYSPSATALALGEAPFFFFFFLLLYGVTNKAYIYTNYKSISISHKPHL
jgi:hypothetical protein